MTTANPPKVLLFTSEIPQSVNAGSMHLFRLLRGYPADRLIVLGAAPEKSAQILSCQYETVKLFTHRLACTRFRKWTIGLNALNTSFEPQLRRSLKLGRAFKPDLVVTVMDKLSYYKHAWALARRLQVPLLTITMDDPQTFESPHRCLDWAFARFLRRMYRDARLSLGVSQEMCDYLQSRFGKPSRIYSFGPPEGIQTREAKDSFSLKFPPKLTLGYAGSMSLGYREGILAMLKTLEATGTRLFIYTKDQHHIVVHPLVTNRGFFPPEKLWPTVQAECDAVVLPYSFKDDIARVYRTHFPTKLCEYCWTGMPTVLSGPAYATGIRWGERHQDAIVIAVSPDPGSFAPLLEKLRADGAFRVALATASAGVARTEFDPIKIKQTFLEFLCEAATRHDSSGPIHDPDELSRRR